MFLQVKVGQGAWEGRGGDLPTEGSGTHTQRQDGGQLMCIPPPGAGGGGVMSARGFKQRCTKIINAHGTHTHTHTGENMLAMQYKSINEWQYQFPSVPYLNM